METMAPANEPHTKTETGADDTSPPEAATASPQANPTASDAASPQKSRRTSYMVVVNNNAGSSTKFSEEALKATVPDADFEILSAAPSELDTAFDKAFSAKPAAVIVIGGDGTARNAAARAVTTGIPVILMPGGTMNILPKIVFGHGDLARAITELPQLTPRLLDVGRIGGESFFLSAAFGFPGPMTRLREAIRSRHKFQRIWQAAGALLHNIGPSLRCLVGWRVQGQKWHYAHSLVIAIGDLDRVLSPDGEDHGHHLEIASLRLRSIWQMLSFGAAFLGGGWRNSPRLRIARAQRVEVRLPGRRPLVVLDGEPMRIPRADVVTLDRDALPVLALPKSAAGETPPHT